MSSDPAFESLYSSTMSASAMPPSVTDYAPYHLAHMINQHLALREFLFRSEKCSLLFDKGCN